MIKHADTERIREDRSAVTGASWFSSGEALRENHEDHFHADEDENTKEDEEDDDDADEDDDAANGGDDGDDDRERNKYI